MTDTRTAVEENFEELSEEELEELATALTGKRHSNTRIFGAMLVAAVISLVAAFVLAIDAIKLAADPSIGLSCNFNEVLNCGTVALSWQASAFGFPNVFLGLMFEPMVVTMALLGLSGTKLPRWFALTEQVIYVFATAFAIWLFVQSMFVIGAMCPWCLTITYVTPLILLTLLHYNIREDNIWRSGKNRERARAFVRNHYDLYVFIAWVALVTIMLVVKYGPALIA
ncbi:vitamin K epoxide reductase family protein [Timonella sp. A28]|uniref:vitamin K epoxide reductase family protein n=1 Tax=Timonella sp. A28 TaxID=3442640 RepID=UPI003EBD8910